MRISGAYVSESLLNEMTIDGKFVHKIFGGSRVKKVFRIRWVPYCALHAFSLIGLNIIFFLLPIHSGMNLLELLQFLALQSPLLLFSIYSGNRLRVEIEGNTLTGAGFGNAPRKTAKISELTFVRSGYFYLVLSDRENFRYWISKYLKDFDQLKGYLDQRIGY